MATTATLRTKADAQRDADNSHWRGEVIVATPEPVPYTQPPDDTRDSDSISSDDTADEEAKKKAPPPPPPDHWTEHQISLWDNATTDSAVDDLLKAAAASPSSPNKRKRSDNDDDEDDEGEAGEPSPPPAKRSPIKCTVDVETLLKLHDDLTKSGYCPWCNAAIGYHTYGGNKNSSHWPPDLSRSQDAGCHLRMGDVAQLALRLLPTLNHHYDNIKSVGLFRCSACGGHPGQHPR